MWVKTTLMYVLKCPFRLSRTYDITANRRLLTLNSSSIAHILFVTPMRHHGFSGSCGTPRSRVGFPRRTCLIILTLYWRVVLIVCFKLCLNAYFMISRLHPLPRNYGESRNRKMTLKEFSTWMIIRCGEIQLGVRPVSNLLHSAESFLRS